MIRFPLGQVVATPGALSVLEKAEQHPAEFLDRHVNGDWGEVPEADKQENERSVEQGFRILSAYTAIPAEPPSPVITGSAVLAFRKHRCENTP